MESSGAGKMSPEIVVVDQGHALKNVYLSLNTHLRAVSLCFSQKHQGKGSFTNSALLAGKLPEEDDDSMRPFGKAKMSRFHLLADMVDKVSSRNTFR